MTVRWFMSGLALALTLAACGGSEKAAADAANDAETPWEVHAERALPVIPAAYSVHAHGTHVLLRTARGLSRSTDGGATFADWTYDRTVAVLPLPDGTALQVRADEDDDDALTLERVAADGTLTTVSLDAAWPAAERRWIGGVLTLGDGRAWLHAYHQPEPEEAAVSRLFAISLSDFAVTAWSLPPTLAQGVVGATADLGTHLVLTYAGAGDAIQMTVGDGQGWADPVPMPGLDGLVTTADGALVVSRLNDGNPELLRVELVGGAPDLEAATVTSLEHPVSLARGADGVLHAVSRVAVEPLTLSGQALWRSTDHGRTWQALARSLDVPHGLGAAVAVTTTGLWTLSGPFVTWRPHTGGPWRVAGLPDDLEIRFLQAQGDERWAVGFRFPIAGIPDGGNHLFYSVDRGVTWQYTANVGVNVSCLALTPDFLFFGGLGDVRGAFWETRDRTGRHLYRNEHVRLTENPEAARFDIIACASSGGPSVLVSQAPPGKTESFLHGVNLQHQLSSDDPPDWNPWPFVTKRRFTALDGQGVGLEPILAAAEELTVSVVGNESRPMTAFYDATNLEWLFAYDLMRDQVGARAAVRRHEDLLVYPTGDFSYAYRFPEVVTGLEGDGFVMDAFMDPHDVLWLGTPHGLFRAGEPVPPPAPSTCEVDFDCPGFTAGDLCKAQIRCRDGACVQSPAVVCMENGYATCEVFTCVPATGQCAPSPAPDFSACGRIDLCHEFSHCEGGVCIPGEPIECAGSTECAPMACNPVTGCYDDYVPTGTPCGVAEGDACGAPGRCTGHSDPCIGAGVLDCDDGNPCTADACDAAVGCTHTPTTGGCDDGNLCTTGDACADGICAGVPVEDGVACEETSGCTSGAVCAAGMCQGGEPVEGACDDGDPCTVNDACGEGACVAGTPVVCPSDDNPCTSDACVPGQGCVYAPSGEGSACSLGDPCRGEGTCQLGWCVGGEALPDETPCVSGDPCVSGEVCYSGSCGGGQAVADGTSCDDGLACSSGDVCERGFCVGALSGEACPALAACPTCLAPAGPALLVAWASKLGEGGVEVLSLRGARLRDIQTPDPLVQGVVQDRVAGDGLWVTSGGTNAHQSIWKIGWDGAVIEEVKVQATFSPFSAVGTLDHVPAEVAGQEVLVLKVGSFQKSVLVVARDTGAMLLQSATFGVGTGVFVDGWVAAGSSIGFPTYWTGGADAILHAAQEQDAAIVPLPALGTWRGITGDDEGYLWAITVGFDSLISRIRPSGEIVRQILVRFPGAKGTGADAPDAFDLSFWPGR